MSYPAASVSSSLEKNQISVSINDLFCWVFITTHTSYSEYLLPLLKKKILINLAENSQDMKCIIHVDGPYYNTNFVDIGLV